MNKATTVRTINILIKQHASAIKVLTELRDSITNQKQSSMFDEDEAKKESNLSIKVNLILDEFIFLKKCQPNYMRTDARKTLIKNAIKSTSAITAMAVLRTRFIDWKDNPEMKKNLVIETIFRASNYPKYVDAIDQVMSDQKTDSKKNTIQIGEKRKIHS